MAADVLIPTSVLAMITRERDALREERDMLREALRLMFTAARHYWDGDDEDGGGLLEAFKATRAVLAATGEKTP